MPVDPILPLMYVQDMGPTAKLAHDASTRPEAAQAMARVMAEEMLRDESKQVQKSQPGEQSAGINTEDGGGQGGGMHHERHHHASEEEEEQARAETGDPFLGKLVNKKV